VETPKKPRPEAVGSGQLIAEPIIVEPLIAEPIIA
jgi:hypothetical protein